MNRDFTPRNVNYKSHSPNCVCEGCSRKRIRETASAIDAWMQFENKRREDRAKRRETRFKRKTERYGRND